MARIAVFGEPLLELATPPGSIMGPARLGFAGDTLNTSVYLARLGHQVDYITALGSDPYSGDLLRAISAEGIGTASILRHPTRVTGLYAIQTDDQGERSFTYWRETSAARAFFDLDGAAKALATTATCDLFYVSGISLSILDDSGRAKLAETARTIRARGGHVAFDANYRPRGWPSAAYARERIEAFASHASLVLPTKDDDDALFGAASTADQAGRWLDLGAELVVEKCGPDGAFLYEGRSPEHHVPVPTRIQPRDTTGAGDSFNAGFMAALLHGASSEQAALAGHRLAGIVIQHPGAIIAPGDMPEGLVTA